MNVQRGKTMMRFVMDTVKGEFSFDVIGMNNGVY